MWILFQSHKRHSPNHWLHSNQKTEKWYTNFRTKRLQQEAFWNQSDRRKRQPQVQGLENFQNCLSSLFHSQEKLNWYRSCHSSCWMLNSTSPWRKSFETIMMKTKISSHVDSEHYKSENRINFFFFQIRYISKLTLRSTFYKLFDFLTSFLVQQKWGEWKENKLIQWIYSKNEESGKKINWWSWFSWKSISLFWANSVKKKQFIFSFHCCFWVFFFIHQKH
jgi:hypothetical protein